MTTEASTVTIAGRCSGGGSRRSGPDFTTWLTLPRSSEPAPPKLRAWGRTEAGRSPSHRSGTVGRRRAECVTIDRLAGQRATEDDHS